MGHHDDHDEDLVDSRSTPPVELGAVLDRVVRGMGAPGTDAVQLVFSRWGEVVGGVLATRTQPVALDRGRLVLEADDPAVVSHVRWLEQDLLARLDELLGRGRVTAVEVRVTPVGRRGRRDAGDRAATGPTDPDPHGGDARGGPAPKPGSGGSRW